MATNTITMQIHFNHHDQRQLRLVENFARFMQNALKAFDEDKLRLVATQPDSATVAWLTDTINKDCEAAANEVRIAFHNAKKDSESRFDMLEADLRHRWKWLTEPKVNFADYELVYKRRSSGISTLKGTPK